MANGEAVATTTANEEPLHPIDCVLREPRFNCYVIGKIGCKTSINPAILKEALGHTLNKHSRFSCKLEVKGSSKYKKSWIPTKVNVEDHVIVPDVQDLNMESPEQFIGDYISQLTTVPMDFSKPLWELHILNVRTLDAEALGVFRVHHSIGDGVSLMSLLLSCTRKASSSLPGGVGVQKGRALKKIAWSWKGDTNSPLKGAPGVELNPKRLVHRTVSLDDIKSVKIAMNATINDVLLGVTEAGVCRYLNRRCSLNRNFRLRTAVLVNIRPTVRMLVSNYTMDKESTAGWGNWIGYNIIPINVDIQDDPLDYVRNAKAKMDQKKQSLEAECSFAGAFLTVKLFGAEVAAAMAHRGLSNTTMLFSNVAGPMEEISFCGHPMAYLALSVYGHPQALTIHCVSYVNKMTIVVAVDPKAIPDPHQLCDDIEESLRIIKDDARVVERGLPKKRF